MDSMIANERRRGRKSRTPMTSTMITLDNLSLFQLCLGHTAYAIRTEISIPRLNTLQTAQILVALLLPFGDQILVGDLFVDAKVIKLATDGLALVEQVVNVAGLLVVDLEDGPENFCFTLALVGGCLGFAHFLVELVKCGLD